MSSEFAPSHQQDLLSLGFYNIEMDNGNTFEPVRYLEAYLGFETVQCGGEQVELALMYQKYPAVMGKDLSSSLGADQFENDPYIFQALMRVADTLPRQRSNEFGTRGHLLSQTFWNFLRNGRFEYMKEIFDVGEISFTPEALVYMSEACIDPVAYRIKLWRDSTSQDM